MFNAAATQPKGTSGARRRLHVCHVLHKYCMVLTETSKMNSLGTVNTKLFRQESFTWINFFIYFLITRESEIELIKIVHCVRNSIIIMHGNYGRKKKSIGYDIVTQYCENFFNRMDYFALIFAELFYRFSLAKND